MESNCLLREGDGFNINVFHQRKRRFSDMPQLRIRHFALQMDVKPVSFHKLAAGIAALRFLPFRIWLVDIAAVFTNCRDRNIFKVLLCLWNALPISSLL